MADARGLKRQYWTGFVVILLLIGYLPAGVVAVLAYVMWIGWISWHETRDG